MAFEKNIIFWEQIFLQMEMEKIHHKKKSWNKTFKWYMPFKGFYIRLHLMS
jgi:hypothetical protein